MRAALLLLTLALATPAVAQGDLFEGLDGSRPEAVQRPAEYESVIGELTPRQIIQQKAQARAAQRMSRIAAMEWYGYSKARPRTSGTPFTGLYGAQFQGGSIGRPSAHYATRPVIVVAR